MRIFLICPVRLVDKNTTENIRLYVERQESEGHKVHWPARDTDQTQNEWDICAINAAAIKAADRVDIWYCWSSQGSIFDLGIAWVLGKELNIVNEYEVDPQDGKSIENLILDWQAEGPPNET